jgi:hypothetical protein
MSMSCKSTFELDINLCVWQGSYYYECVPILTPSTSFATPIGVGVCARTAMTTQTLPPLAPSKLVRAKRTAWEAFDVAIPVALLVLLVLGLILAGAFVIAATANPYMFIPAAGWLAGDGWLVKAMHGRARSTSGVVPEPPPSEGAPGP